MLSGDYVLSSLYQLAVITANAVRDGKAIYQDSLYVEPVSDETERAFFRLEDKIISANHYESTIWLAFLDKIVKLVMASKDRLKATPPITTMEKELGPQIEQFAKTLGKPVDKKWELAVPSSLLVSQSRACILIFLIIYVSCLHYRRHPVPKQTVWRINHEE